MDGGMSLPGGDGAYILYDADGNVVEESP